MSEKPFDLIDHQILIINVDLSLCGELMLLSLISEISGEITA